MPRIKPPQMLAISFLVAIVAGGLALSMPGAAAGPGRIPLIDAFFTATSAVCVTGLIVVDTGSVFSSAGTWIIFTLFQAGGLGIMTFSMLFAVLMGKKIGLTGEDTIRSSVDRNSIIGLEKLLLHILVITLTFELLGAAFLFLRWRSITSWTSGETLRQAVFHSVSGFCNAGFSLFRDSLTAYRKDPFINLIMMGLVVSGGIGFLVIMDIAGRFGQKAGNRKLSLHSKIVLSVSGILILVGAGLIFIFEQGRLFEGMSIFEKVWASFFQSVSSRTAGFNTVPIGEMALTSQLSLVFLMFVGASPGSAGGGIKTVTFAVLAVTVFSILKNRDRTRFFSRSMSHQVIREAFVIVSLAIAWIFVATMALLFFERSNPAISNNFMNALFEVTSAFGTVGLSTGVTSSLSFAGKLCIIATMYAGRIGPLTLALAVAFRNSPDRCIYPEENIMVG